MTAASAVELLKRLHPEVADLAEMLLTLAFETHEGIDADLDAGVEEYARALAKKWGAFPYDGPVGNQMTLAYYQESFRELAVENIMVLREAAVDEPSGTSGSTPTGNGTNE